MFVLTDQKGTFSYIVSFELRIKHACECRSTADYDSLLTGGLFCMYFIIELLAAVSEKSLLQ